MNDGNNSSEPPHPHPEKTGSQVFIMALFSQFVQFVITYPLFKTQPLVFCKFLFSNYVNSLLLSKIN